MNDVNNIFSLFHKFSEYLHKKGELRAKIKRENRIKAQNNPRTKIRKSESMKLYWKKKKQNDIDMKEAYELEMEYGREHCTCHLGNPPCSFCTDSNYCEDCDIVTTNDDCPNCLKDLSGE